MGIGSFMFGLAMTNDIRDSFDEIHNNATTDGNGRQALEQISTYIQFHSDLKQLSTTKKWSKIISKFVILFIFI